MAGIFGSILARFAQKLLGPSTLFSHGKAAISTAHKKKKTKTKKKSSLYETISTLTVSKHYFWHFYAFGLLSSSLFYIQSSHRKGSAILLAIQCFRRMIECFFVMPGAKGSQMHLIHYGIGISYYPILLLSFHINKTHSSPNYYYWVIMFIISSMFQSYCHWILGSIRKEIKSDQPHRPINHFLFKFIHSPHYFAELMIYFSIAGMEGFHPLMLLNLIWIITILGVSACNSADWLCGRWGYKSKGEFCKYLMIPFLF